MLKSLRYAIVLVLALAIALPLIPSAEAQSDATQIVVPAGETIKIGLATDLSNVIPEPGADIRNGALIAVQQANEAGGVEGFEFELDVQDDRCEGADATNVANLFAADPQVTAVVGHVCSGASIPASAIYQDARIPMVSPSSTASAFTASGFDVVNRVAFTDAAQGVVDARFIYEVLGVRNMAILHDNSDYGKGLADEVQAEFERIGGTLSGYEAIDIDDQDYRPVLTVLAAEPPELIFFGGYQNQAALLVSQMQEVGLADTLFFSDDGTFTQAYIDQAGDSAEGTYASFVDSSGFADAEANEAFDAAYEEAFGVAPDDLGPFHAHAYDAANLIMEAIRSVATVDDEGNLVINREDLISAVRATENHEGLTGTLTCDENGECGAGIIGANIVEDGEWVAVEVPAELQFGEPYMMDDMGEDEEMSEDEEASEGDDTSGEMGSIVEIAASTEGFSNLAAAVALSEYAETLAGEGEFTVFAPNDEAFEAAMAALGATLEDIAATPEVLNGILAYHIYEGRLTAEDVAGMGELTMLDGGTIAVSVDDEGNVTLNDSVHLTGEVVEASNGVIIVIDGVLLPN
ncbi:MAG: ABC transporter substrate-binding protein [Chloroflexi bacterium]|nr:ABC transporter substrate-binding protein [Chloroflexota bacterium]